MEQNDNLQALAAQIVAKGQALDKLAPAFVAAWAEIDNVAKDATNPAFHSGYATLGAVLDTVKGVFRKHKLAVYQSPGEIDGDKIAMVALILHESGQSISARMQIPLGQKLTAQAAGSAITYARRYQLAAIAGITQVDDDGTEASSPPDAKPKKAKETKDPGYAAKLEDIAGKIDACTAVGKEGSTTPGELTFLLPLVREFGDAKLTERYIAKRNELRGAK